jgi:hypothetical protein
MIVLSCVTVGRASAVTVAAIPSSRLVDFPRSGFDG